MKTSGMLLGAFYRGGGGVHSGDILELMFRGLDFYMKTSGMLPEVYPGDILKPMSSLSLSIAADIRGRFWFPEGTPISRGRGAPGEVIPYLSYLCNKPLFLWVYRRNKPLGMLGDHEKSL